MISKNSPLVFQNVQTYRPGNRTYIGMPDLRNKPHLRVKWHKHKKEEAIMTMRQPTSRILIKKPLTLSDTTYKYGDIFTTNLLERSLLAFITLREQCRRGKKMVR